MSDYSKLLDTLKQLVCFRTTAGDPQYITACFDYIEARLTRLPLHISRYESNGCESLMAVTRATKHPAVLLQAHIDVVPGYGRQFNVRQRDGRLYGRGVYDMKFAAACFIHLLERLGDKLADYDIGLMLTADEEVDGHNGVEYLLNQGYAADVCILPDSGEDWNIEASAKGFLLATVTAKGSSAHGSRPWEADNAATRLVHMLAAADHELPLSEPLGTTCSLTRLDAGPAYNQIPGEARADFDIRFTEEAAMEAIQQQLGSLCRKHDCEVGFTVLSPAIQHDVSSPFVETWQTITQQLTGHEPGYTYSFAASDARYLVPRGITTISARPKGGGHHGPQEWINEKELYEYYEVVREFVTQTAIHTKPVAG